MRGNINTALEVIGLSTVWTCNISYVSPEAFTLVVERVGLKSDWTNPMTQDIIDKRTRKLSYPLCHHHKEAHDEAKLSTSFTLR